MTTLKATHTVQNKEKTTFRSLPLEIQQQICSAAIALSQQRLEETFIHDKITYFNPVRIYSRLETCIKPNRLISASRYMNIRKACPGIEPVPRGLFGNKYMLYIELPVLDVNKVIWLVRKFDISRIALDLRSESHDCFMAEGFLQCLLIRAAHDRISFVEMLVILPSFDQRYLHHGDRSIPRQVILLYTPQHDHVSYSSHVINYHFRLIYYGNARPVLVWLLDPWMEQFWIKPTSMIDMTDATAATFFARHGLRESKLCRCHVGLMSESENKFEALCWHTKFCPLLRQVMKGNHFW